MSAKDQRDSEPSEIVDRLVEEAKDAWLPPSVPSREAREKSDAAEEKLFARIEAFEQTGGQARRRARETSFWGPALLVTAAAAGALFFMRPHGGDTSAELSSPPVVSSTLEPIGSVIAESELSPVPADHDKSLPAVLTAVTNGGEARMGGERSRGARLHAELRDGETVEAHGGDAIFSAPSRASWLLESGTVAHTERAGAHGGPIVLALDIGAVEAQVVPVTAGEAFAVDIDGVRVAVHGTHLRVARPSRVGSQVVVDLSEGVISVGTPPKTGSTVGTLVVAPAHVEFSAADVSGTLHVDHDPKSVRAPVDPAAISETAAPTSVSPSAPETSLAPGSLATESHAPGAALAKPPTPAEQIMAAVNRCATETLPGGPGTLTISSMLTVDVKTDGTPGLASFNPPLVPDLQTCVGRTVYATHWSEPGPHRIPIELHR